MPEEVIKSQYRRINIFSEAIWTMPVRVKIFVIITRELNKRRSVLCPMKQKYLASKIVPIHLSSFIVFFSFFLPLRPELAARNYLSTSGWERSRSRTSREPRESPRLWPFLAHSFYIPQFIFCFFFLACSLLFSFFPAIIFRILVISVTEDL